MAIKKAYYYKFSVLDKIKGIIHNNNYKDILDEMFRDYLIDKDTYMPIILNEGELIGGQRIDRVTMDIISNDMNYLFARVSKSKDNKDDLIRNITTNEIYEVLSPNEIQFKTLETYTYFILDYINGVLVFVEGLQSPSVSCLKNIIDIEMFNKEIIIDNIASEDTIRALVQPGSVLSKIHYDFRVPSPEILKGLGVSGKVIDILTDTDVTMAKLTIKNDPRKSLTKDINIIQSLVNELKALNTNENKVTIEGKTKNSTLQEYSFEIKNFMTPIDIPTSRISEGEVIQLTLYEIAEEYFIRMRAAYIANIGVIKNLANI